MNATTVPTPEDLAGIRKAIVEGTVSYEQAVQLFMTSTIGQGCGLTESEFVDLLRSKFPTQERLAIFLRLRLERFDSSNQDEHRTAPATSTTG